MEGEVRMSVYQEAYKLPEFKYEYERLKVDVRGPIHVVSFDDAANLNAMSYQQMADFNDYLKKVRMDPECRVIVLTGEGRFDSQSIRGKVISGVSKRAREKNVPVVVVAGSVDKEMESVSADPASGIAAVFSINRQAMDYSESKPFSRVNYQYTLENVLRTLRAAEHFR